MNPDKILKNIAREASPDSKFKKELWLTLNTKTKELYPGAKFGFFASPAFKYAIPLVIVLFSVLGTGAYAYESPNITESHPLYSVKQGIETVEGKFKFSSETKAEFHLKMMGKRTEEAKKLGEKNQYNNQTLKNIFKELDLSLEQIQEIRQTAKKQSLAQALGKTDADSLKHLEQLIERLPEKSQTEIKQLISEQALNLEKKLESLDEEERKFFEQNIEQRENMTKKKKEPPRRPPKKLIKDKPESVKTI